MHGCPFPSLGLHTLYMVRKMVCDHLQKRFLMGSNVAFPKTKAYSYIGIKSLLMPIYVNNP